MRPKEKGIVKKISEERINILLGEAEKIFAQNPERAKRYVQLAFAIVRKNRVRLTKEQKLLFCRKCFFFWRPGKSLSVFFDKKNKRIIYECKKCSYERKIRYK